MSRCGFRVRCCEIRVRRRGLRGFGRRRSIGCWVSRRGLSGLRLHVRVLGVHRCRRYGMALSDCRSNPLTTSEMFVMLGLVLVMLMHHVLVVFTHFAFMIVPATVMLRCLCRCNRRSGAWNKNRCETLKKVEPRSMQTTPLLERLREWRFALMIPPIPIRSGRATLGECVSSEKIIIFSSGCPM